MKVNCDFHIAQDIDDENKIHFKMDVIFDKNLLFSLLMKIYAVKIITTLENEDEGTKQIKQDITK